MDELYQQQLFPDCWDIFDLCCYVPGQQKSHQQDAAFLADFLADATF